MSNLPSLFREPIFGMSTNPFREMARMQRQVDRLFENLWGNQTPEMTMPSFTPSCDIEETGTHYLMSFDLPGAKKEDIKIELHDNQLTISGERKEEHEEKGKKQYQSERFYGAFIRSFTVPTGTKSEQIETEYKDGVLKVAVPKREGAKTQQIKIGESKSGFWEKLLSSKKEDSKATVQSAERRQSEKVA